MDLSRRIIVSLGLIILVARCAGTSTAPSPSAGIGSGTTVSTATVTLPPAAGEYQRMDGSRFTAAEGFSFVPPVGWYLIGRWELPSETQYVFSTVAAEHNVMPGQLNLVLHLVPNVAPDVWLGSRVTEKQITRKAIRQVAGTRALQVDFDQNRDPQPLELSAGTYLLIPNGDNLVAFSAFGNTWAYYLMYAGEVEDIFKSFQWEPRLPAVQGTVAPNAPAVLATPTPTSTSLSSNGVPSDYYPLGLGNVWVYQDTRYDALPITEYITATHIITETVVDIHHAPSFFAAKIRRDESGETPLFVAPSRHGEVQRPPASTEYWLVLMGNQLFRQEKNVGRPDLRKSDSRELVSPLQAGAQWYLYEAKDPTAPDGVGGVLRRAVEENTVQVPAGRFDNCFMLKDDWATDTVYGWFCPGVGWVEKKSDHNGTPFGSHSVLLGYHVTNAPAAPTATATPNGLPPSAARSVLERFMQARIQRDEQTVLGQLSDRLLTMVYAGVVDVPLMQVSNPCWYRYQVLNFSEAAETSAQARVRVYEHQWPGDSAGSLPRSWEQDVGLAETIDGWRVDRLGPSQDSQEEPGEPHGPTLSACNAYSPTPAPPQSSSEFRGLQDMRAAAAFPVPVPTFVPETLPFSKAWVFEYGDGSNAVRILYRQPGDGLDANLKTVDILVTKTNQPVTIDSVTHQFRQTAWDVHEVQVRGQAGYAYWSPAAAQGNSAVLTWREGGLNLQITLLGDWPQPTEQHPRDLDGLLLKIAESLTTN